MISVPKTLWLVGSGSGLHALLRFAVCLQESGPRLQVSVTRYPTLMHVHLFCFHVLYFSL